MSMFVMMALADEFGITILKPSFKNVWSQWLLGKQNPDITPPNLKNRSWHDFPPVEVPVFIKHILTYWPEYKTTTVIVTSPLFHNTLWEKIRWARKHCVLFPSTCLLGQVVCSPSFVFQSHTCAVSAQLAVLGFFACFLTVGVLSSLFGLCTTSLNIIFLFLLGSCSMTLQRLSSWYQNQWQYL